MSLPVSGGWGDVEGFLRADRWTLVKVKQRGRRRMRHVPYEKMLSDGRVLRTRISHDRGASISPGRFRAVLRYELEVTREQFWAAIRTGEPVNRIQEEPDEPEKPADHPAWVVAVLAGKLHLGHEEIARLSPEEAQQKVEDYWSRPGK